MMDPNKAARTIIETQSKLDDLNKEKRTLQRKIDNVQLDRTRAIEALEKCVGRNVSERAFIIDRKIVIVTAASEAAGTSTFVRVLDPQDPKDHPE